MLVWIFLSFSEPPLATIYTSISRFHFRKFSETLPSTISNWRGGLNNASAMSVFMLYKDEDRLSIGSKWIWDERWDERDICLVYHFTVFSRIVYLYSSSVTAKFYTAATMLNSSTSWRRIDLINKSCENTWGFIIRADTYKNTNHNIKRNGYTNLRNVIIRN